MDNVPMNQQSIDKKPTSPVLWVVFGIVILAVAGGIWYVVNQGNGNTNTTNKANSVVNNSNTVAQNTNQANVNNNNANTANTNADPYAGWNRFSGTTTKVSLRYPNGWSIGETNSQTIVLTSPDYQPIQSGQVIMAGNVYVNVHANPKNLSIKDLMDTFSDSSRFWYSKYSHQKALMNGRSALYFPPFQEEQQSYHRTEYFMPFNGKVVGVSYLFTENTHTEKVRAIAASISLE